MTTETIYIASATLVLLMAMVYVLYSQRAQTRERLYQLCGSDESITSETFCAIDWKQSEASLSKLKGRLGKAGFYSSRSRIRALILLSAIVLLCVASFGAILVVLAGNTRGLVFGAFIGGYIGLLVTLTFLKRRSIIIERQILYRLPLALEAILLLVQSGLGILPAIQTVILNERKKGGQNPALFFLSLVYELTSSGLPLGTSLELVANNVENRVLAHVFMHLDISANEGGELSTSLRSLSDYAHSEWKLAVETRVRRLENFAVFPVFFGLMGLVMITISVPLVPIADFMGKMSAQQPLQPDTLRNNVNSPNSYHSS